MKFEAIGMIKMSTFVVLIFALCASLISVAKAQFREDPPPTVPVSGSGKISEFEFFKPSDRTKKETIQETIPGLENQAKEIEPSHKSSVLAGVLSFALPGLGEYYVGDHIWRGIIFTVLDAGLWYERYHYIGRFNDSTTAFQGFSDTYFSPALYAARLDTLLSHYHPGHQPIDPNDISQINRGEDSLNILGQLNFAHQLPARGSQQYYEIISKYKQYRFGWKDYVDLGPEYYSPDYEQAAYMRANTNYQYQVADYFLYGLFLNRILSAIDAVLLAKDHNTPVHLEGELQQRHFPNGALGFVPTAHLTYRF